MRREGRGMDERERREWVERLRAAVGAGFTEEMLERRLYSFKDICARPFGRTGAEVDRDFSPDSGATLDFNCLFAGGESFGVLTLDVKFFYQYAGFELFSGLLSGLGYPDVTTFLDLVEAGDAAAVPIYDVCERYVLRPAYLYAVLNMTGKIEEALHELREEAVGAMHMHLFPEGIPLYGAGLNLGPRKAKPKKIPAARRPSKWAELLRATGDASTTARLEPFAPAQSKPSPDAELDRALKAYRKKLKRHLALATEADTATVSKHISLEGLAEAAGLSKSSIQRYVRQVGFKNFTDWKEQLFS